MAMEEYYLPLRDCHTHGLIALHLLEGCKVIPFTALSKNVEQAAIVAAISISDFLVCELWMVLAEP